MPEFHLAVGIRILTNLERINQWLILLNKSDLADERYNQEWSRYFEQKGYYVLAINSKAGRGVKNIYNIILEACKEKIERNLRRGIKNKPIRAMVVGIPIGKIHFYQCLCWTCMRKDWQ